MTPEEQGRALISAGMDIAGRELVQIVQYEINEAYPPASAPYNPPHLRTGNLQAGITYAVDEFHDGVTLNLISEMFYSSYLRDGTSKMDRRDFMGSEAADRYVPYVVQILQNQFASGGSLLSAVNTSSGIYYPSSQGVAI